MLGNAKLYANLAASDLDRALDFYEGKLGLPLIERREVMAGEEEVLFDAGGAVICIAHGTPAQSNKTPIAFEVDDAEAAVAELRSSGVEFEEYDLPMIKTENGIASIGPFKGAWFRDPDGNLIGITSRSPEPAAR